MRPGFPRRILHFAASTPNIRPYMEYLRRSETKGESWYKPNFAIRMERSRCRPALGLGLEFDLEFLKKATILRV